MSNYWLRLYAEIIDDEKIRMLAFEDRWHYVAILCCKKAGILDEDGDDIDFMQRRLGVKLGLHQVELESLKKRLMDVRLIDEKWQPTGWDGRQFVSDTDPTNAERQRRFREKNKQQNSSNALHNVTVTGTETETETETDIPTTPKDKSLVVVGVIGNADNPPSGFEKPKAKPVPYAEILNAYHELLPTLKSVYKLTDTRKKKIQVLARDELETLGAWRNYFSDIAESKFLTGRGPPKNGDGRVWMADFDFIIEHSNFVKIAEGRYHDKKIRG